MKTILHLFSSILAIFLFAACGGNYQSDAGSGGGGSNQKVFTVTPNNISVNGNQISTTLPIKGNSLANVKLTNIRFSMDGCTFTADPIINPSEVVVPRGSSANINITANVVDRSCISGNYTLSVDAQISENGRSKTESDIKTTVSIDENGNILSSVGNPTVSTLKFTNLDIPVITKPSENNTISIDLVDSQGKAAPNKDIEITVLPKDFGSILNTKAKTDAAGRAKFSYKAPAKLDDVNGQSTPVRFFYLDSDTNATLNTSGLLTINRNTANVPEDSSLPVVVVPEDANITIIDKPNQSRIINIRVFKDGAPFTTGNVKVQLPEVVLEGKDIGFFSSYTVPIDSNGIAKFSYTGPSNLKALVDSGFTSGKFLFYHEFNPKNKQELTIKYNNPVTTFIDRNYEVDIVSGTGFSMGLPNIQKSFSVNLLAKDNQGKDIALDKEKINSITVKTKNSTIAELIDVNNGGTLVSSLNIGTSNNSQFILQSKRLSGLVPVEVTVEFTDVNGKSKTLKAIRNIRVLSGPPTAMSISYVSTSYNRAIAKYVETYAITAVDEYANKINTKPNITIGAIVGYAVDGRESSSEETSNTKRLFYGSGDIKSSIANGEIKNLGDADPLTTEFVDNTPARDSVFQYVNTEGNNSDKLVIFGPRKNYEAFGKWDIHRGSDDHTLTLEEPYFGADRSKLSYAIGHNYYQDLCRDDSREWVGFTDSNSFQLDESGTAIVTYTYDIHLGGKDAILWVNLTGEQPDTGKKTRIGEVYKGTLRTTGLTKAPAGGFSLSKGEAGLATFSIWHRDAPEQYRNAHFGYNITSGSKCTAIYVQGSNDFDARTCATSSVAYTPPSTTGISGTFNQSYPTNGQAYVTYFIYAPPDQGCTFDINNILVASEF